MYYWYIEDAISRNFSYLIPCPILYAEFYSGFYDNFQAKRTVFSLWGIFKKTTALLTLTTFQESSSGKRVHILLAKCLSCYIVMEIFVISVVFNVFSLNMGWSRFLLREFSWIWIDVLNKPSGIKILFPSNVYWH